MPTLTTRSGRACLRTWWPDQLAGSIIAAYSLLALAFGGQAAIDGVGLAALIPTWLMQAWFLGLAVAGVALVVGTECDAPTVAGSALLTAAALLSLNAVATLGPNGSSAMAATIAYTVASIYLLKRAQDALMVRIGRGQADRYANPSS